MTTVKSDVAQLHRSALVDFLGVVVTLRAHAAHLVDALGALEATTSALIDKYPTDLELVDAAGVEPACARVQSPAGIPTTHTSTLKTFDVFRLACLPEDEGREHYVATFTAVNERAACLAAAGGIDKYFKPGDYRAVEHAAKPKKYCGLIQATADKRIGGPRSVCMKPRGHAPPCGDWERMTQVMHAHINDGRE